MDFDQANFLVGIKPKKDRFDDLEKHPFNIPAVKDIGSIDFHPNVTFFVGENGSGKSTVLEAIAVSMGFNAEGGTKSSSFVTRDSHSNYTCIFFTD